MPAVRPQSQTLAAEHLDTEAAVGVLRAAAEPTRLRILALLAVAELSVKDLTLVLGQSQPRISRHLKLLAEAGLIARFREGAWVNIRLSEASPARTLVETVLTGLDPNDAVLRRDNDRALALLEERTRAAEAYFADHASEWDDIRSLHVDEERVESAMRDALGAGPFEFFLDVGTGTGRILELFGDSFSRGLGVDTNPAMLAYARSRLETGQIGHAQVRQMDLYNLALEDGRCDAIVVHQVLHFLTNPAAAIAELARVLAPGGRLLVVDLAPHELTFLRQRHAHRLMGISDEELSGWFEAAGLGVSSKRILAPSSEHSGEQLTVDLWVGEPRPDLIDHRRNRMPLRALESSP